jgi:hypothetical protein
MQIILKNPGQAVSDFSVSGNTVSVSDIAIDCAARQEDTAVTIEIRKNVGGAAEGGNGAYLAQIVIPSRQYSVTEVPAEEEGDTPNEIRTPIALDPNAVAVTLWPLAE